MTVLQELMANAAVANETQLAAALAAMKRTEIEHPLSSHVSVGEIRRRYSAPDTGKTLSRSTVYRRLKLIGVTQPSKKIGGLSYFLEQDVVRAFDSVAV